MALTNILITLLMCSGSRRRVCKQSSPSGVGFPQYKHHFLIFYFINSQSWRGCSLSLLCLCISNCGQVAFKADSMKSPVSCTRGPMLTDYLQCTFIPWLILFIFVIINFINGFVGIYLCDCECIRWHRVFTSSHFSNYYGFP